MLRDKLTPRLIAFLIIGLILGTAILWVAMWTITAAQYHKRFDAWIEAIRAQGSDITYDQRSVSGFPGMVVMQVDNLRWHNGFGAHAEIGNLTLSTLPFNAKKIRWQFNSGMSLTLNLGEKEETATIHADNGDGSLRVGGGALWEYFNAHLINLGGAYAGREAYTIDNMKIIAERPEQTPKDHTESGMDIDWHIDNINVLTDETLPFGKTIREAEATVHVMGTPPNPYDKASVAAWNAQSNVLECENLMLDWGALQLSVKGTIGLDDDLQPEGAFAGTIGDKDEFMKALLETNWIPQRQAGMLNAALSLFSGGSHASNGSLAMPISIQLGGVFLGPIRIFAFPDIPWPTPTPAQN